MNHDLMGAAIDLTRRLLAREASLAASDVTALAVYGIAQLATYDPLARRLVTLVPCEGPGPHAAHVNRALGAIGVPISLARCRVLLGESPAMPAPPAHPWSDGGPPTTRPAPAAPPVEADR